jgi:aspartyl/asparaginyl beta-hydroxylase (cupin superfamily)
VTDNRNTLAQAASAFQQGRLADALALLNVAHAAEPRDPMVLLSISVVLREQGDGVGELRAIQAALVADEYCLPALLALGDYHERNKRIRAAGDSYRNALLVAPPEAHWPPALRAQLAHAREVSDRVGRELAAYFSDRMGAGIGRLTPAEAERWREAGAILSGQTRPYPSVCNRLCVPRIPAIPFFERKDFDWVDAIEGKTAAITEELKSVLDQEKGEFRPYIDYQAGSPINQWRELNHSQRWSSYFLWRDGKPVAEHLASCPVTAKALSEVEVAEIDGLCPNSMFSALAPHTRIPPHHGETNARVVVHLPLIVPANCHYRVGFEHRQWKVGELLIFDDSIEHEARNDSDELRVVLIFDAWNPLLSAAERDMVKILSTASREFRLLAQ